MGGDETQEPTLREGDQSVDGWVEYLQQLINHQPDLEGRQIAADGEFGPATRRAVVAFQRRRDLMVDGIAGNQTWAALRDEVPQDPGTDGHEPGTFVEEGLEARWFDESDSASYDVGYDQLALSAINTGNVAIDQHNAQLPTVVLTSGSDSFELEGVTFYHADGRAEPGELFWFVCERVSATHDGFVPIALTVRANMTTEFGGDELTSPVVIVGVDPAFTEDLVSDGATLVCSFGSMPSELTIPPRLLGTECVHQTAHINDTESYQFAMFGMCSSMSNPEVAAAMSAADGVLVPVPCAPIVVAPWTPGSNEVTVEGVPALTPNSTCHCVWEGVVLITTPGTAPTIADC